MQIAVYDLDADRREVMVRLLSAEGLSVQSCYSDERLNHWVRSTAAKDWRIVLCPADQVGGLTNRFPTIDRPVTYAKPTANAVHEVVRLRNRLRQRKSKPKSLVVIGSSTGGLPVVCEMIRKLQFKESRIVICQHVAHDGTAMVRDALAKAFGRAVVRGEPGTRLKPGSVTVIPSIGAGIDRAKRALITVAKLESPCPRIDQVLGSLNHKDQSDVGIIIVSGLGDDGSQHLRRLEDAGAEIAVQDPATCVAPPMPIAAAKSADVKTLSPSGLAQLTKGWLT